MEAHKRVTNPQASQVQYDCAAHSPAASHLVPHVLVLGIHSGELHPEMTAVELVKEIEPEHFCPLCFQKGLL